jgi:hypothetical protein
MWRKTTAAGDPQHKVLTFTEHHSVCPLVGIGTPPTPLPQASVPPPPDQRVGGGAHPPAPKGVGEFQFRRWRKSLALCLLCAKPVLFLCLLWQSKLLNTRSSILGLHALETKIPKLFRWWAIYEHIANHTISTTASDMPPRWRNTELAELLSMSYLLSRIYSGRKECSAHLAIPALIINSLPCQESHQSKSDTKYHPPVTDRH